MTDVTDDGTKRESSRLNYPFLFVHAMRCMMPRLMLMLYADADQSTFGELLQPNMYIRASVWAHDG